MTSRHSSATDQSTPSVVDNSHLLKSSQSFDMIISGGVIICAVFGFVYLIALNSISTRGFDLEKIKSDRMQIVREMEQLEIDLAIPLSLYALQSSTQIQSMPEIKEKEYLFVKNGGLAKVEKVLAYRGE